MKKIQGLIPVTPPAIESIGGETLAGSGFEREIPDAEFSESDTSVESAGR